MQDFQLVVVVVMPSLPAVSVRIRSYAMKKMRMLLGVIVFDFLERENFVEVVKSGPS